MPSGKRVSVYEVAARAGISIATVSRALNQPHVVSAETREKVLAAVRELNYVPDSEAAARARTSHTRVAVVSPVQTYPGYASRLRGILTSFAPTGAEVIVFHIEAQKLRQTTKYFDSLAASGRYDALIIMSLPLENQELDRLASTGFPTVLVETVDDRFPTVQVNHEHGSYLATQHLIDKGYTRLGFIGFDNAQNYALDAGALREAGFRRAMEENNLPISEKWVVKTQYGIDSARQSATDLLAGKDCPRALVCASDVIALGAMKACEELGLASPREVAIIGFDDIDMAAYLGLSTIHQPLQETGVEAAELIQTLMRKAEPKNGNVTLELKVVERSTT